MSQVNGHNSFTIIPTGGPWFSCKSHNFPHITGVGQSPEYAWDDMNRQLTYIADNQPQVFQKNIKDRLTKGLKCNCGVKLEEPPVVALNSKVLERLN